ncbi:MAG: hypothetical protein M3Y21_06040 [Candidatus Eremiobacteraeota bacterium]|nr:hypothetical protein [Candidatus Eremiobacteraeota bacterium]
MIAEKLLNDPSVLAIAQENLGRWREAHGDSPALQEWQQLLDTRDRSAILFALLRIDEEGMRLRSSSPFTNILSDFERSLIFEGTRK